MALCALRVLMDHAPACLSGANLAAFRARLGSAHPDLRCLHIQTRDQDHLHVQRDVWLLFAEAAAFKTLAHVQHDDVSHDPGALALVMTVTVFLLCAVRNGERSFDDLVAVFPTCLLIVDDVGQVARDILTECRRRLAGLSTPGLLRLRAETLALFHAT